MAARKRKAAKMAPKLTDDTQHLRGRMTRAGPVWFFSPSPALRRGGVTGFDYRDQDGRPLTKWAAIEAHQATLERLKAGAGHSSPSQAPKGVQAAPSPAAAAPAAPPAVTVGALLDQWLASSAVLTKRPATIKDYRSKAVPIRRMFGDQSPRVLTDPIVLEDFHLFLRATAGRTPQQALANLAAIDAARGAGRPLMPPDGRDALATAAGVLRVLSAFCRWCVKARHLKANPVRDAAGGGGQRLAGPRPAPRIASLAELAALKTAAGALNLPHVWFGLRLAVHTGARPGDLLALDAATTVAISAERNYLRLIASKTGATIELPLTGRLQSLLAEIRAYQIAQWGVSPSDAAGPYLVRDGYGGKPYASYAAPLRVWWDDFDAVRQEAAKACPTVETLRFKDLRATAVTLLAEAGCTIPEICAITGHSLKQATQILEHYRANTRAQADAATAKLDAHLDRLGVRW